MIKRVDRHSAASAIPNIAGRRRPEALLRAMDARGNRSGVGVRLRGGCDARVRAANGACARLVRSTIQTASCRSASSIRFTRFPPSTNLLDEGFKSIKILTGWGNWLTIGNVRRVVVPITQALQQRSLHVSIALEGNIPVTGGSTFLPLIVREACPDACIVLDHCWLPSAWEDYLALAQDDRNLWFTLHSLPQALLTRVVRELGLARIVLGSWLPETDPDLVYAQLQRAAGIGDGLASVLRDNARTSARRDCRRGTPTATDRDTTWNGDQRDDVPRRSTRRMMTRRTTANVSRRFPFYEEGKVPQYHRYHAEVSYLDELPLIWGKPWGAQGIGRLREVAMVQPTATEVRKLYEQDSAFFVFNGVTPDLELMQRAAP